MTRKINSVAVLGGGTMGAGIAGLCAQLDCEVLLLDTTMEVAEAALERIKTGRPPAVDDIQKADNIALGTLSEDLDKIASYDWICEAIIEDLDTKRALFERVEKVRRDGSVISTNTSGIPLRDITQGMPERLCKDIAVTHFFNPVKVMKLMELIPGEKTTPDVMDAFTDFLGGRLSKGVVNAKDTVNFIGNRIGCFYMLMGLHKAQAVLGDNISMEDVDGLMGMPVGLPSTGLYGLIDLIGLDVMDLVGKNLDVNLPQGDAGRQFSSFPAPIAAMWARGQLGRKSGGGFYRINRNEDGPKTKETFDLTNDTWRAAKEAVLDESLNSPQMIFGSDAKGKLAWEIFGETLCYAADLVPQISDDIVNIDRAMKWGFGWAKGPFEFLDLAGPENVISKLKAEGRDLPKMLAILEASSHDHFYSEDGTRYLGSDGEMHRVPAA